MKTFKCEEMMCNNCVSRINKALGEAGIEHQVDLSRKTVAVDGDNESISRAVELLEDMGFDAVEI